MPNVADRADAALAALQARAAVEGVGSLHARVDGIEKRLDSDRGSSRSDDAEPGELAALRAAHDKLGQRIADLSRNKADDDRKARTN